MRHAELANPQDVEFGVKDAGYFISQRHPTARQCENDDVVAVRVSAQTLSERAPCVYAILKQRFHKHLLRMYRVAGLDGWHPPWSTLHRSPHLHQESLAMLEHSIKGERKRAQKTPGHRQMPPRFIIAALSS